MLRRSLFTLRYGALATDAEVRASAAWNPGTRRNRATISLRRRALKPACPVGRSVTLRRLRGVVSCVCFAGRRAARCRGAARDRASPYMVAHFVRPLAVACGPSARLSRERRVPIGRHWPVGRDGPRWANWRTISDGPGEVASGPDRAVLVSAGSRSGAVPSGAVGQGEAARGHGAPCHARVRADDAANGNSAAQRTD
jgi:hypothetical protein